MPEALRRIDAEVVDLLERRLAVAAVVLVRRKAAPVPRRRERLADHQPLDVRIGDEDVVHLARVGRAAALVDADVVRTRDRRRGRRRRPASRRGSTSSGVSAVDAERRSRRHEDRRRALGEDVRRGDTGQRAIAGGDRAAAFEQHGTVSSPATRCSAVAPGARRRRHIDNSRACGPRRSSVRVPGRGVGG